MKALLAGAGAGVAFINWTNGIGSGLEHFALFSLSLSLLFYAISEKDHGNKRE